MANTETVDPCSARGLGNREPFPWPHVALSALLVVAEGASVAQCLGALAAGDLPALYGRNFSDAGTRGSMLLLVCAGAMVPALAVLIAIAFGRRRAVGPIRRAADMGAPLMVAAALPAFIIFRPWHSQPLPFLLLLAGATLLLERMLRRSLPAMPVSPGDALAALVAVVPVKIRRWWPLATVLLAASGYAVYAAYYTILTHHRLGTAAFDLAIYDNLMFNALHGHPFRSPMLFGPDGGNYIAGHAELAMLLFVPFYAIAPGAENLLVIQSVLLGFAALPLYLFAATQIPRGSAAIVALGYLLFAPLHGAQFYDFHWLPIAIFFNLWLFYAIAKRRTWLIVAMVVILFAIREDVPVGIAVLGVFLLLSGARPVLGAILAAAATSWFGLIKFVIMPAAGHWWFADLYKELAAPGERGYGSVIETLMVNPLYFLSTLVSSKKLVYALHMFVPVAFLPFRRAALLLLACPGIVFTLMTTGYQPTLSIAFQYAAHWIPYLFGSSVLALGLLARGPGGVVRRRAALAAMTLAILSHSYVFGAILQRNVFVGGFSRVQFAMTDNEDRRYRQMQEVIALIPEDAVVAATDAVCPHVSARATVYTLRLHHGDAEYLLIQKSAARGAPTHRTIESAFASHPYGLVASRGNRFFLFQRDHESTGTRAAKTALGFTQPIFPQEKPHDRR